MAKTIPRDTWGQLRQLNTAFLTWCAATHADPTSQNLLRWLYVEDYGPDRNGWSLSRIGYAPADEVAKPPAGQP